MPFYDFRCKTCEATLEKLQRRDAPAPVCPADGAHGPMKQLFTTPNFSMGFAQTVDTLRAFPRMKTYRG